MMGCHGDLEKVTGHASERSKGRRHARRRQLRESGSQVEVSDYLSRFPRDQQLVLRALEAACSTDARGASRTLEMRDAELSLQSTLEQLTIQETTGTAAGRPIPADLPEIPGYEILDFLGRGGMGVVLRARHRVLDRLVAIKMPRGGDLVDEDERERFMREARSSARLHHRNICPIHEVGQVAGRPYLAMGLIRGQTLSAWAKKCQPSPRQAAEVVAILARAVGYAHEHGVIHRDLKPSNVMLDEETGEPVLMDFGLAKELSEEASRLTHSGQIMGTPAYMAPEQASGRIHEIGPRADVYSLGAILYELLCQRTPFVGSVGEVLRQVECDMPAAPRTLNPRIHRDLETICLKALSKLPPDRYASAEALAEDLERFAAGEAILARREGMLRRVQRRVRRSPVTTALLVIVIPALAFGGYFATRAQHARRVTAVVQSIDADYAGAWTEKHLARMDDLVEQLSQLDRAQGELARTRVLSRFGADLEGRIRAPRIHPEEIAQIEQGLQLLTQRDRQRAVELEQRFRRRLGEWQTVAQLEGNFDELDKLFSASDARRAGSRLRTQEEANPTQPRRVLSKLESGAAVRMMARFDPTWSTSTHLGLALNATQDEGYLFELRAIAPGGTPDSGVQEAPGDVDSFASARQSGGKVALEISRNGIVLRRLEMEAARLVEGDLHLQAERLGDQLVWQVNSLPAIEFQDPFPLATTNRGVCGVVWPSQAGIKELSIWRQPLPREPSLLEKGDELFARARWDEALDYYSQQPTEGVSAEFRQEAAYKSAVCLLELGRRDEALGRFSRVAGEPGDHWPPLAICQIWVLRLQDRNFEEAEVVFQSLSTRYNFAELTVLIPEEMRRAVLASYDISGLQHMLTDPDRLRNIERATSIRELLGCSDDERFALRLELLNVYRSSDKIDVALQLCAQWLREVPLNSAVGNQLAVEYSILIRQAKGNLAAALNELDRRLYAAPAVIRPGCEGLLLERARLLATLDRWSEAEDCLEELLRINPGQASYHTAYQVHLLRGFLREHRGDMFAARAAWKAGAYANWRQVMGRVYPTSGLELETPDEALGLSQLASLSLTPMRDDEISAVIQKLVSFFSRGNSPFVAFLSNNAVREQFLTQDSLRQILESMWRTPRGFDLARRIAFRQLPLADFGRLPIQLGGTEFLCLGSMSDGRTNEQEEIVWDLCRQLLDATASGKFNGTQLLEMALTWRGVTNFAGWDGLKPTLDPSLRGPLAYVMGHRLLVKQLPAEAQKLFADALADAPADSPLAELARFEVEHASQRQQLAELAQELAQAAQDPMDAALDAARGRLRAFRAEHAQTPLGGRIARLASKTPWPADALACDASNPSIQKTREQVQGALPTAELAAVLGGHMEGHWAEVTCIALDPRGSWTATGANDGAVKLWDVATGALRQSWDNAHQGPVTCLAASPDGTRLVSGSEDSTIRLWDLERDASSTVLHGHRARVTRLAFSPDGRFVASAADDGTIKLWDVASTLNTVTLHDDHGPIHALCFVGDLPFLASSSGEHSVRLWDMERGERCRELEGHTLAVYCLASTADGSRLFSGGQDGLLNIWSIDAAIRTASPDEDEADSNVVPTVRTLAKAANPVFGARFTADGRDILVVTPGNVGLWNIADGTERQTWSPIHGSVALAADAQSLVVVNPTGQIDFWDLAKNEHVARVCAHVALNSVDWSADGRFLCSGLADGTIRVWDAGTAVVRWEKQASRTAVRSVVFSPNDAQVGACTDDGQILILRAANGDLERTWTAHTGSLREVAFSPDGLSLASVSHDMGAKIWDANDGRLRLELQGHVSPVESLAYHPDGTRLATGAADGTILEWDTTTGSRIRECKGLSRGVDCLAYDPRGRSLFAASRDATAMVWNPVQADAVGSLSCPRTLALRFSPDGRSILFAGMDGRVRWVDPRFSLPHSSIAIGPALGPIWDATYSPEGRHVALGCGNGAIYVLRLQRPNSPD